MGSYRVIFLLYEKKFLVANHLEKEWSIGRGPEIFDTLAPPNDRDVWGVCASILPLDPRPVRDAHIIRAPCIFENRSEVTRRRGF